MKVIDKDGNLIAVHLDLKNAKDYKSFYTENSADIQFGVFNLPKNESIIKHYHPEQRRVIKTTTEVLILMSGKVEVSLYDTSLEHIKNIILQSGSVLITLTGGHGIEVLEESKMIEVKQGPYDLEADKVRF